MTAREILNKCKSQGISLWLVGDKIRYRGPAEAISDEFVEELKRNKSALIKLLSTGCDAEKERVNTTLLGCSKCGKTDSTVMKIWNSGIFSSMKNI